MDLGRQVERNSVGDWVLVYLILVFLFDTLLLSSGAAQDSLR
jgi:hypothetical protein